MHRLTLPSMAVAQFASAGVTMSPAARVDTSLDGFAVDIATYAPDSVLGRHPTHLWQLFAVVSGEAWAEGSDGERVSLTPGHAVLWEPGEEHSSGSDDGMVAVIVQSPEPPLSLLDV
jgi:quercetin dioxygenase-like cupin family protein